MTDHTSQSRRALLRGAVALPVAMAATLPLAAAAQEEAPRRQSARDAIIPAAPAPDPIFAAIAEDKRLGEEWDKLINQLDEAEGNVKEPIPSVFIAWREYGKIGGAELKEVRNQFLSEKRAAPAQIEREYQEAKERERAAKQAVRAWYKRHGLAKLKGKHNAALRAHHKARMALTTIRPTTLAGSAALVAFVRHEMDTIADDPWQMKALANVVRALRTLPNEALPPYGPPVKDLELSIAVSEMQNLDEAIDQLHKDHGDDADGRDDYHQLEAKRDAALNTLADTSARSSNGMIAKAKALTERRVIEDYQAHGYIGTSLANDVLRYFGASIAS